MKQLFLFTSAILLVCGCNTQKKLFRQQKETTKQIHWETDSLQVRNIYQQLQVRSLNIRHIQLTPPDSNRKQAIHSITLIETNDKEIKELVTEQTGIYSSVLQQEKETETTQKNEKQTKTRFRSLVWFISLLFVVVFIGHKCRG